MTPAGRQAQAERDQTIAQAAYVRCLVDKAPPLSARQVTRLAALVRGGHR